MNIFDALEYLAKRSFYGEQAKRTPKMVDYAEDTGRDPLAEYSKGKGAMIEQDYLKRGERGVSTTADIMWSDDVNPDAVNLNYILSKLSDSEWQKAADLPPDAPMMVVEGLLPEDFKRDVKAHEQRHGTLQRPDLQDIIRMAAGGAEVESSPNADLSSDIEEGLVRMNDYYAGKTERVRDEAEVVDPENKAWKNLQFEIIKALRSK